MSKKKAERLDFFPNDTAVLCEGVCVGNIVVDDEVLFTPNDAEALTVSDVEAIVAKMKELQKYAASGT